jgi:hypothetical protein
MTINLKITYELWKSLDLEFLAPWDHEAQARLLDLGLSWIQPNDNPLDSIYSVVDEKQFLLSVIEYGLDFKRCD